MNLKLNITGVGKALPKYATHSTQLDEQLGLHLGTIEKLTGLKTRYFLSADEKAEGLIQYAAYQALRDAGLTIDDIDCIINASATMHQALPYNAATTCQLLCPHRAVASFDINMTCLSALRALEVAAHLLESYPRILIISCDIASVGLDWRNLHSAGLFGDGAAAMLIERPATGTGKVLASCFETHPIGYDYCTISGGGHRNPPGRHRGNYDTMGYFRMQGKALYRLTAEIFPPFLDRVLQSAQLRLEDIDWVVPHQASRSALEHLIKRLKVPAEKCVSIFSEHGNQVAASIPTTLYHLFNDYPVKSGDKILLTGTSAGVGLGAIIWEKP